MKDIAHSISLLVANRPGVLVRIALVFSRRGYNIDSLVVSPTLDPNFSRMNIIAHGNPEILMQIIKQLEKLVDVVQAKDHTGTDAVEKELALIKVRCTAEQRTEILQLCDHFHANTVDMTMTSMIIPRQHGGYDDDFHDYPDYGQQHEGRYPQELVAEVRNRRIHPHGQGHHAPRRRQDVVRDFVAVTRN